MTRLDENTASNVVTPAVAYAYVMGYADGTGPGSDFTRDHDDEWEGTVDLAQTFAAHVEAMTDAGAELHLYDLDDLWRDYRYDNGVQG